MFGKVRVSFAGFTHICQSSTEFHFPHFEDQLEKIRLENVGRTSGSKKSSGKMLQTGDVFITRHSNLAQVHVIFHMVSDDSTLSKDMNSRHPVLLGLRNILKTACSHDVTSLTIPLLLNYEMTEVRLIVNGRFFGVLIGVLFVGNDRAVVHEKGGTRF